MTRHLMLLAGIMLLGGVGGCMSKLETGYVPRKLGTNDSQRRAYYASPYSPESHSASGADVQMPQQGSSSNR